MRAIASAAFAACLSTASAGAAACGPERFESLTFTVCAVSSDADIRLFLDGSDGRKLGSFERLTDEADARGLRVTMAMNAGMYHPDRAPVGLYIEEGHELSGLVTRASKGNFGLLPNGVFCLGPDGPQIVESRRFRADRPSCRYASQSGPMLVIDGALHPRFLPDSTSRYVRNGVGVSADGATIYFVISDEPVTFHEFARLFRDGLGTPDALYFDGNISRLYAPEIGRNDIGFPMGPIVAVLTPKA
jgi:uncharacterized protein YigE (DUF2233 family)